jgi:predicted GNAT family acetyltransferase
MDLDFEENPARQRFEVRLAGQLVGFADYRVRDGVVAFTHTEVEPALRGQGIGARLVGAALDSVRARGARALPLCSFVADYVDSHPDYADLVAS